HPAVYPNALKDTPAYITLSWSKFDMMKEALRLRPDATHVVWIDAGIAHVAHDDVRTRCDYAGDEIALMRLRDFNASEWTDLPHYTRAVRGAIAGGVVAGPRETILWLCEAFSRLAQELLDQGFAMFEEQILAMLVEERREAFTLLDGSHEDVLQLLARC